MAGAMLVSGCVLAWALQRPWSAPLSSGEALIIAVRWLLAPALCLLAGIGLTANRRCLSRNAIDGGEAEVSHTFAVNLRYNQNTLEQAMLAAFAWTGLAVALPGRALALLPALAGLFVLGRVSFWLGYLTAPWARAFGFGLTFYPTAAVLIWLASQVFTAG